MAIVGAIYLACIIALRFAVRFDALGYRLLGPGVFCLFVALVFYAEHAFPSAALQVFRRWWIAIIVIGFLMGSPLYLLDHARPFYLPECARILRQYESVPPQAIVAFGDMHLRYLRPDLDSVSPLDPPHAMQPETMAAFLERIKSSPAGHVVIEMRPPSEMATEDRAAFMRQHEGERFVVIR